MSREQPATAGVKVLYRPFALVLSTAGGLIGARVFREVWMRELMRLASCLQQQNAKTTRPTRR